MSSEACPKCGNVNEMDAAVCVQCGENLIKPVEEAPLQPTAISLDKKEQPGFVVVKQMDYVKAGIGKRIMAHVVDALICLLPIFPGAILMAFEKTTILGAILLFMAAVWMLFYSFCKDGFSGGQSYGKKMNGLMVVTLATNQPCTKMKSFLRQLGFCIPYIGGVIEVIMILATEKGRRLGDHFAGTQVIAVQQYRTEPEDGTSFC